VSQAQTMTAALDRSLARGRLSTGLMLSFAVLAFVLAVVGLYGVISYTVDQRAHEIGIRMALGAERRDVLRMVLREGLVTALAGVAIGVGVALAATRLMTTMLFDTSPTDLGTYAAVAILLVAVSLAATLAPARRASAIDPVETLRS